MALARLINWCSKSVPEEEKQAVNICSISLFFFFSFDEPRERVTAETHLQLRVVQQTTGSA